MLQLILDEAETSGPSGVPGRVHGIRAPRMRFAAAAAALVALLMLAGSSLTHVLAARQPAAALPAAWDGRTRIAAVQADVGGDETSVIVTPATLDLAFVTACPAAAGAVEVDVTVNGTRLGTVGGCIRRALGAVGPASLEAFWSSFRARAGQPLRVGLRASVRTLAPGTRRPVPPVVYLGVYEAGQSALPPSPRTVTVARGLHPLARAVLGAERPRTALIVLLHGARRAWFSGACGGPADALTYTLVAGDVVLGHGRCSASPRVLPLDLRSLPAGTIREGTLTVGVRLGRVSGEPLVDHPPSASARVVVTLYAGAGPRVR